MSPRCFHHSRYAAPTRHLSGPSFGNCECPLVSASGTHPCAAIGIQCRAEPCTPAQMYIRWDPVCASLALLLLAKRDARDQLLTIAAVGPCMANTYVLPIYMGGETTPTVQRTCTRAPYYVVLHWMHTHESLGQRQGFILSKSGQTWSLLLYNCLGKLARGTPGWTQLASSAKLAAALSALLVTAGSAGGILAG